MRLQTEKEPWKMEHLSKTNKWDKIYMGVAELISSASYCNIKKVGAIIVKDNSIISFGYNGTPSGFENNCEDNGETKSIVLHAESNAISKCAMSVQSTFGASIYCTLSPCQECAKLIIQSGIKKVVYRELYRCYKGINLLKQAKVKIYGI
jgi:dCMP deaminase